MLTDCGQLFLLSNFIERKNTLRGWVFAYILIVCNWKGDWSMIYQYEIDFSVMYSDKITDVQSTKVPAHSLEIAKEKLMTEVKRRMGNCEVLICSASLQVPEDKKYSIMA